MELLFEGWEDGEAAIAAEQGKGYTRRRRDAWDVFDANVLSWAHQYVRHFGERVNAHFADRITKVVAAGLADGDTLDGLRDRLNSAFFGDEAAGYRADTIARSESVRARRGGANESWRQSEIVEAKFWQVIPAAEWPCEFCEAMDGTMIGLDEEYWPLNGEMEVDGHVLRFDYEAVKFPPLHPRCRCTERPKLADV